MRKMFQKIAHIGLVVNDVQQTAANYVEKYGIGPWSIYDCNPDNIQELEVYGQKRKSRFLLAACFLDDIGIELIQPMDDKSIYYDFLKKNGENLHHIGYETEDYGKTLDYLKSKGLEVSMKGNFFGGNDFSYIDGLPILKHIAEFSKSGPDFFAKETSPQGIGWLTKPEPISIYPSVQEQKSMKKPLLNKLAQVAFIVHNINETVKVLADDYGIGPWKIWDFGPEVVANMTARGKRQDHRMRVAIAKIGDIDFELIQPLDEFSIYYEDINKLGECFHHVAYIVNDYDKVMQQMEELSLKVSTSGTWAGKHSWTYLTTEEDLKHIVELNKTDPDFITPEPKAVYP